MKIIVGLGNPGEKYKHTRHNVGFIMLDWYLADKETISCQSKFAAQICEIHFTGNKTFFVKPQTFMNSSGEAVKEILHFYKAFPNKDLLVVHDEVDLPFGTIRASFDANPAGHNGVKSIIDELGTKEFLRIRIGVEGRESRNDMPTDAFVLHNFTDDELKTLKTEVYPKVRDEIDKFLNPT
jgi:PTH1 family peptidyl-tRNA hydrolase